MDPWIMDHAGLRSCQADLPDCRAEGAMSDSSYLPRPPSPKVTRQKLDAALNTARAGLEGRSRTEARDLLVTELRARGLMLAPPEVDLLVDNIFGGVLQRKAQRLAWQTRAAGFAARFLGAALSRRPLPPWDVTATRAVLSTLPVRPVEVIVDLGASQHLSVGENDMFEVWLAPAAPGSGDERHLADSEERSAPPVAVFRGSYQVGVLDRHASSAWWPVLRESQDRGQIVITSAVRKPAVNGEWRLLAGFPYRPSRRPDDNNDVP
jgi:hypothetical protein